MRGRDITRTNQYSDYKLFGKARNAASAKRALDRKLAEEN